MPILKPPMKGILNRSGAPISAWASASLVNGFVVNVYASDLWPNNDTTIVSSRASVATGLGAVTTTGAANDIDAALSSCNTLGITQLKVRLFTGVYAPQWAMSLGAWRDPVGTYAGKGCPVYDSQNTSFVPTGSPPDSSGKTSGQAGYGEPFPTWRWWTAEVQAAYQKMMYQLGALYDSEPKIHDVTVGMCMSYFAETCQRDQNAAAGATIQQANRDAMHNCGFSLAGDIGAAATGGAAGGAMKFQMDAAIKGWPTTPLSWAENPYQKINDDGTYGGGQSSITTTFRSYWRNSYGSQAVTEQNNIQETSTTIGSAVLGPPIALQTETNTNGMVNIGTTLQNAIDNGGNCVELPSGYTSTSNWIASGSSGTTTNWNIPADARTTIPAGWDATRNNAYHSYAYYQSLLNANPTGGTTGGGGATSATNNFEMASFDLAVLTAANTAATGQTAFNAFAGGPAFDNDFPGRGTWGVKVIGDGTEQSFRWGAAVASATEFYLRLYLRLSALPAVNVKLIDTGAVSLEIGSAGHLYPRDAAGLARSATVAVIPLDTTVRVEWHVVTGATAGSDELRYYLSPGAAVASYTEALTHTAQNFGTTADYFSFGSTNAAVIPAMWFDEVAVAVGAGTWLGPSTTVNPPVSTTFGWDIGFERIGGGTANPTGPPTVSLVLSPTTTTTGNTVTATATATAGTAALNATPYLFEWNDINAGATVPATSGPQSGNTATRNFTTVGRREVRVTVTDTAGLTATANVAIDITATTMTTVSGTQTAQYKVASPTSAIVYDMRTALFRVPVSGTSNTVAYPLSIGTTAAQGVTIFGPTLECQVDRSTSWNTVKSPTGSWMDGAACVVGVPSGGTVIVDSVRSQNTFDSIRPIGETTSAYQANKGFIVIRHVYGAYTRDDCVENDYCLPGIYYDCLWQGINNGFSCRPSAANAPYITKTAGDTLTIDSCIVWLQPLPHDATGNYNGTSGNSNTTIVVNGTSYNASSAQLIKFDNAVPSASPDLVMRNCTFLVERVGANGPSAMNFPQGTYSNNTICYLGLGGGTAGVYPGNLPTGWTGGTNNVVTSDRTAYDAAVTAWFARHPDVTPAPGP